MKNNIKFLLSDIRFWIVVFFLIRLFHSTFPPLDMAHSWRQCYTLSIARYYYEHGVSWLYPHVTHRGIDGGGIAGCEFPLLNAIIAYLAHIWGYNHWFGRIVNMTVTSIGIYYFYRLMREYLESLFNANNIDEKHDTKQAERPYHYAGLAFFATISLLSSVWFAYGRKAMPDTFSVALVIMGLYYGLQYAYRKKILYLLLYFCLVALGVLSKLPAMMLLVPLVVPVFDTRVSLRTKTALVGVGAAAVGIAFIWYFYWVPYLVANYHNELFFPTTLRQGLVEVLHDGSFTLERMYATALYSYIGNALLIFGLVQVWRHKSIAINISLVGIFVLFILYILKTGVVFSHHVYYVIPFIPVMSFLVGVGIQRVYQHRPLWAYCVLAFMAIEGVANQFSDFYADRNAVHLIKFADLADRYTPNKEEVVMVNSIAFLCPIQAYFLHRNALSMTNSDLSDNAVRNTARDRKINTFYVDKKVGQVIRLNFPVLYEDEYFLVYDVR